MKDYIHQILVQIFRYQNIYSILLISKIYNEDTSFVLVILLTMVLSFSTRILFTFVRS